MGKEKGKVREARGGGAGAQRSALEFAGQELGVDPTWGSGPGQGLGRVLSRLSTPTPSLLAGFPFSQHIRYF